MLRPTVRRRRAHPAAATLVTVHNGRIPSDATRIGSAALCDLQRLGNRL